MISISRFEDRYTQDVIDLVLHFQNDGTRPPVTVADQPDLLRITHDYIEAGGDFWMARDGERLAGTIGLLPLTDTAAVLKKFFVYEPYQGAPHHLGSRLYEKFLDFAKAHGYRTILLDTAKNTTRAHKFYRAAGFRQVTEAELPVRFSHPIADCHFFQLDLK